MLTDKRNNSRILVVDDEADLCQMFESYFEIIGFETSSAGNAADAYALMEQGQYDVIITDISMPGEDGISLLGRVRHSMPDIPVILMAMFLLQSFEIGWNLTFGGGGRGS